MIKQFKKGDIYDGRMQKMHENGRCQLAGFGCSVSFAGPEYLELLEHKLVDGIVCGDGHRLIGLCKLP